MLANNLWVKSCRNFVNTRNLRNKNFSNEINSAWRTSINITNKKRLISAMMLWLTVQLIIFILLLRGKSLVRKMIVNRQDFLILTQMDFDF